jgi:hypothetical protein
MSTNSGPRNIVLVHGAFVDGSSWRAVYDLLLTLIENDQCCSSKVTTLACSG